MNVESPLGQPTTNEADGHPHAQHRAAAGRQPSGPASALRVSAGVLALIVSVIGVVFAGAFLLSKSSDGGSTPFNGWMNFFLIVGAIGCLVTGIVILAKQRKRGGATPWLVAAFAACLVISCLGFMSSISYNLPGAPIITLPLALATLILAVLVIAKDKVRR
ncbi:hypothetical protein AB4Y72_14945 [Arthrobacter sp. YAF34]|uniref:hypothetical protein n=1 Tax=Arthrobacter sp. YAF34 TaxID=3233083 RepID=UPI003F92E271